MWGLRANQVKKLIRCGSDLSSNLGGKHLETCDDELRGACAPCTQVVGAIVPTTGHKTDHWRSDRGTRVPLQARHIATGNDKSC